MKKFIVTSLIFVLSGVGAMAAEKEPGIDENQGREFDTTPDLIPTDQEKGFGIGNRYAQFTGRLQTLFLWRNDSDFDRTPPFYNANGQDVGVIGTFLAPKLTITPIEQLKMVFEMEIGLNVWSAQSAESYSSQLPDWFRLAFRQAYVEGSFLKGKLGFRAGYEQLFDPTWLFAGYWLGAANIMTRHDWGQITFTVAQMPDQTFEGIAFDENNFNSDTILYGVRLAMPFKNFGLDAAVWGIHDSQVVDRTMDLMAITANLEGDWKWIKAGLDLGFQYGVTRNRAGGEDETTVAWALGAYMNMNRPVLDGRMSVLLDLNFMALSADDDYDGNDINGAWFFSGKSRSRTMILTEDEIRDRGGNIDELMSDRRNSDSGKFYLNRAGLTVTDLTVGLQYKDFFRPMLTIGAGWTLNDTNSLGSSFVGMETDLHLEFMYKKYLSASIIGSCLMPGKAAAAFINRTDNRESTDMIYQTTASVTFYF